MATYTSVATGDWSDSSKWTPVGVPGLTDLVRIASGHTITLDGAYTIGNETAVGASWANSDLVVNGTLRYSRTVSSSLTIRGVGFVSSTGTLDMGSAGDEIPGTITAELLINGSASSPSPAKHRFISDPGARFLARSQFNRKRCVKLTAPAASGQPQATFSSVRDWQVGDQIRFAPATNVSTVGLFELMTISSIAGNTVTFTTNFTQARGVDHSAMNVTSNIRILPANGEANGANFQWRYNNSSASNRVVIRDVLFGNCGVTEGAMGSNTVSGTASAPWSWAAFGIDSQGGSPSGLQVGQFESCVFHATAGSANARHILCPNGAAIAAYPIRDLAIYDATTTAYAMYISTSQQVDIDEMLVLRCGGAIIIGYSFGCNGGTIRNADFCNNSATQNLINLAAGSGILFEDCTGSGTGGTVQVSHHGSSVFRRCRWNYPVGYQSFVTNPYAFNAGGICNILFDECSPAPTVAPGNQLTTGEQSFMTFANSAGDPTSQITYSRYGSVQRDNAVFRTAAPSLRLTPLSATKPLQAVFQIPAPTGKVVAITGFWRKTDASIAATATLFGLNAPTVSTSMPSDLSSFTAFSLSTMQTTGTDAALTCRIDVTGTAGFFNIDDFSSFSPDPVSTGAFGIYIDGKPVPFILSSAVTAADVWSAPQAANGAAGSMGEKLLLGATTEEVSSMLTP